jgi:hypothetical protein
VPQTGIWSCGRQCLSIQGAARFPNVGYPSFLTLLFLRRHLKFLGCSCVSLRGLSSCFLCRSSFSTSLPLGQLPQKWPHSPKLWHANCLASLRPLGGQSAPPECPGVCFVGPGCQEHSLQFKRLLESFVHHYVSSQQQLDFNGGVFYSACERFACLPPYVALRECRVGAVGKLFDGCGKLFHGFLDTLGPCF